jgi:hypothetical protein
MNTDLGGETQDVGKTCEWMDNYLNHSSSNSEAETLELVDDFSE